MAGGMRWPFSSPRVSDDEPMGAYVYRVGSRFGRQLEARQEYLFARENLAADPIQAAIYAFEQCDLCEVIDYSALEQPRDVRY